MNFLSLSKSHFLKFYGFFIAVFQIGLLLSTTSQTFGQSGDISVNVDINQSINIELNASSLADANSSFSILSQPSSGSLSSIELVDQEQLENPSGTAGNAGQIFTPSISGHLSKIKVTIWPMEGGYLEVRPYSGDLHANMFDGELLGTSNLVSDMPSTSEWTALSTFNFTDAPYLEAGEKYVFQVLNALPYTVHGSNPYPGGHADDTTNPGNTGKDLKFQTYMHEANKVTYQPEANFEGSDSFNFSINNNGAETNATTFITVGDPQDENSTESEDDNSTDFIPIYELNSTHLYALTAVQGSAYESNYSIVEELNASNQLEIRFHPMVQSYGNWFPLSDNLYYYKNNSIQSMQDVEAYLQSQNLQPINLTSETESPDDDFQSPDDFFTSPDDSFESPDDDFQSPDDSFTSPDDSFESPDDDFQSPDDSFTSPDDSFESPDDDFQSPDDSFTSPDDSFESPDDDFQSPDDSFTSPDDSFESPDDDFQSPDDSFTSPEDSFESPDDDFQSPDDSFTSPDDSFESPDDDYASPGEGNYTGLPIFALTINQAETLTDGLAVGGNYAIEIFTDFESGLDFRILLGVVQLDGNWSRELDYHGESFEYAISTATFPTVSDIDLWLSEQGLYPIGFLNEMEFYDPYLPEDHNESKHWDDLNETDPIFDHNHSDNYDHVDDFEDWNDSDLPEDHNETEHWDDWNETDPVFDHNYSDEFDYIDDFEDWNDSEFDHDD
ncbi:MAG: hypothetical protein VX130_02685, partial [Verrucomicrobiota bacterium]|nr:hypothetical protein [Verrucomicrobiota bacterium]